MPGSPDDPELTDGVQPEDESGARSSTRPHRQNRKRLRILIGGMIALLIVFVVIRLDLTFPGGDDSAGLPLELDRCVTQQAVLDFLDGKKVFSDVPTHETADGLETIMLRKEKISALKIRPGKRGSVVVRFNLDGEGKQYLVEAVILLSIIDDPELHIHGWSLFMGRVLSSR
jgi:hypothetical protein